MSAMRAAFAASVALFGFSLVLPAFSSDVGQQATPGMWVLLVGWLGLIAAVEAPANLAWLANVALAASWGFAHLRMRTRATAASVLALGFAAMPSITWQVAVDEGGMPRPIAGFGSGYAAWLGAMAAALATARLIRSDRVGS